MVIDMEELYILDEVLESLKMRDYEGAMIELQDYEGGIYDQIRSAIGAEEYNQAMALCEQGINDFYEQFEETET